MEENPEDRNYVKLLITEYDELLEDSRILHALYGAGVDNWDGWDYAMQSLEEEE